MRKCWLLLCLFLILLVFTECGGRPHNNHKDLDDNMLDLMMYHDNLGLYLREHDADYAGWLLEGLDRTLQQVSAKFTEHRKLKKLFEKEYSRNLAPPINGIRKSLETHDFPTAISYYRTLTRNCNRCHDDNDIDKVVIDWSDASIH